MAAVINRALTDIAGGGAAIKASDHVRDEAMAWINSPGCETYCDILCMDYEALREKAAALYRRFLEKADRLPNPRRGRPRKSPRQAPEKAGTYTRIPFLSENPAAVLVGRSMGILERGTDPDFTLFPGRVTK
jgi:hypothetical protein